MPRKAIDYSNTAIYKLVCNDVDITDIYVGHTTNFVKRKANHRSAYFIPSSNNYNCYVYQYMRAHGGFHNWSMIEIEKYPCDNKNEACSRERYWLEKLHATLNKEVPGRTKLEYEQQYRENNKEDIAERHKQYRERNKDKIHTKQNEKFECKCGSRYTSANRSMHFKTKHHLNYICGQNKEYEYCWDDGSSCSEQDYYDSLA